MARLRPGGRSTAFEGVANPADRDLGAVGPGPLGPPPRLGLCEELLQLAEDEQRRGVATVEGLDPIEPVEHAPGFIHTLTVAAEV